MKKSPAAQTMESSGRTIGEIVADDYRTSKVFESHGIDFCCGGKVSLLEICKEKKINLGVITDELEMVKKEPLERAMNYASWELPFLADYIINVHHSYLKDNTSHVSEYAKKIAVVHGAAHPEVKEISKIFDKVATDLMTHMRVGEEEILFPAIKRVVEARKGGATEDSKDRETIKNSVLSLMQEHDEIGAAIHTIRHLAKDFAIPSDACNIFVVTYQKLKEFEEDLHKHVHLENNLLFLKATQQ
ncbi:MAG: iron-sulfur cluster repair di-iron protein [Candidatus Riflebacteria bacterium]|nr:iron-sulfur cluster repair di-iron protein [Candidatus Riflebacteria bacterium]